MIEPAPAAKPLFTGQYSHDPPMLRRKVRVLTLQVLKGPYLVVLVGAAIAAMGMYALGAGVLGSVVLFLVCAAVVPVEFFVIVRRRVGALARGSDRTELVFYDGFLHQRTAVTDTRVSYWVVRDLAIVGRDCVLVLKDGRRIYVPHEIGGEELRLALEARIGRQRPAVLPATVRLP